MDTQEKQEIRKVEHLLGEIRSNTTSSWKKSLSNGLLYGAGVVLGTTTAVVLLGVALSLMGVIPGLDVIAARFSAVLDRAF
ncbi:MAG TPA: hypothetical protein VHD37_02430 [Candidatus Paceibacterota bacterium]|nr:hypothetical protein [Candidatus Paceibacterota bacterium]